VRQGFLQAPLLLRDHRRQLGFREKTVFHEQGADRFRPDLSGLEVDALLQLLLGDQLQIDRDLPDQG
jgi:hypothetical protein